ncbi:MAG TPA: SusD/RagB family nutrient-binding outer membrane lipoprotein [Gemmatimonadaceae bacterium]|nr:SusD/RagB family nutrient-binding outer membrane lipoprotein [Gemmatimonadaceae bacterium]
MNKKLIIGLIGASALLVACGDNFLTGGELTNDPNRPTQATSGQLLTGIEANVWAQLQSDPARVTNMWVQQLQGEIQQYFAIYNYQVDEQTTNGFQVSLYTGGGLVDIRKLESQAAASHDSLTLGIAQTMEALLVGTGADMFGNLTYTQALTSTLNPTLDSQLAIYDSVQSLLTQAVKNMAASGPSNAGPGSNDLAYGGDAASWIRLAHTLKARYLMHTAEVRSTVYPQVLAEAKQGITDPSQNFNAVFSGNANEQNFWYQFDVVQRTGYLAPDPQFVALLKSRNDPRLGAYFNADLTDLNDSLIAPNHTQPIVTANEGLLLAAEAAQRTGDNATALTDLNQERALNGLPAEAAGLTGRALLSEILIEEYIADFQNLEAWNLYKRTCTPNLVPVTTGGSFNGKIPARFPYDASERNTNSNIPPLSQQPARNPNDPANATSDGTGGKCLGQ